MSHATPNFCLWTFIKLNCHYWCHVDTPTARQMSYSIKLEKHVTERWTSSTCTALSFMHWTPMLCMHNIDVVVIDWDTSGELKHELRSCVIWREYVGGGGGFIANLTTIFDIVFVRPKRRSKMFSPITLLPHWWREINLNLNIVTWFYQEQFLYSGNSDLLQNQSLVCIDIHTSTSEHLSAYHSSLGKVREGIGVHKNSNDLAMSVMWYQRSHSDPKHFGAINACGRMKRIQQLFTGNHYFCISS